MSKRTFFGISIACMLAGVLPLQAQNDAPAFKDSCEWSVSRYKFRTIGDTVKEGITYLKVYRDMDDSAFIFDESRATLYALMRYDAPAKRLYGLDPADSVTKEFLMYDFSMKEGDTIDIVAYKRSFDGGNTHMKAICTS
ncbi:MAG: hypothetical protein IKX13_03120 [Bacteroidales bacterium]|nr:hypothetical protein [Bacteroidales bacterium]